MASNHHLKRPNYFFYIFISLAALLLLSSHYLTSYSTTPPITQYDDVVVVTGNDNASCDYSQGKWFYDPTLRSTRYEETCKEIYKGWNCIAGNRSGADDILKWRWQPHHCALPLFDPLTFLKSHKDISIGNTLIECTNLNYLVLSN